MIARFRRIIARISKFLVREQAEEDLAREVASHLTLLADDFERRGMSPEEARLAARSAFGPVEQAKQAHRDERTLLWIEQTMQDVRYGLRTLSKSPGFTVTAVFTLALGIGACTAIFSLVNAVLIRSLPYGDPSRLVYLYTPNSMFNLPAEAFGPASADFYDIKRDNHSFQDMTAFDQAVLSLASSGAAERVSAARVDGDFFRTFQSTPELGRAITSVDNQVGHEKVAVISHSLWQSMFGSTADVLHHSLLLDGKSYQIVGVMPPGFEYPHSSDLPYGEAQYKNTQVWIPRALTPQQMADRENAGGNGGVARLKPGVSIAQAQAEMAAIMARLDKLHDPQVRGWGALIENFVDSTVGHVRSLLWLLLGAVSMVLLIACGNAANLLLARAASRMRELGVRVALGAGRSRIIRQLLTEALLIGFAAGAIGIGLAFAFLRLLPFLDPGNIPRLREACLDTRVLLFTVAVSLLTSILTGILPALAVSRINLTDFLATNGSRSVAGAHTRVQSALIVAESALVVVLLTSAGLLIRSYVNVESVDTGFSQSTVTANIGLDPHYSHPQAVEFFRNLFAKLQALPGVEAVGAVNSLPLSNSEGLRMFAVDGYPNQKGQLAEALQVTPNYFSAMRIPLIAGRLFTADENPVSHTIIVNQNFARKYFTGRNPIGGRVSRQDDHTQWSTVVGVIGDVRDTRLEEPAEPQIYEPDMEFGGGYIVVRSSLPARSLAATIRTVLHALDPNLAAGDIQTMGDLKSAASAPRRFQTSLLTVFAAIALLLALVGLYGLMAYSVSRRIREVGIRMALGAQRTDVMLLVLKKAALLLAMGLVSGLVASWFAARALQAFLFEVSRHDPVTTLSVCAVLAICGLIAAMVPACRAASIDPMQALRTE